MQREEGDEQMQEEERKRIKLKKKDKGRLWKRKDLKRYQEEIETNFLLYSICSQTKGKH